MDRRRSLAGCNPWGLKELDMTKLLSTKIKKRHVKIYLTIRLTNSSLIVGKTWHETICG